MDAKLLKGRARTRPVDHRLAAWHLRHVIESQEQYPNYDRRTEQPMKMAEKSTVAINLRWYPLQADRESSHTGRAEPHNFSDPML